MRGLKYLNTISPCNDQRRRNANTFKENKNQTCNEFQHHILNIFFWTLSITKYSNLKSKPTR